MECGMGAKTLQTLLRCAARSWRTKLCLKLRIHSALAAWGRVLAGHPCAIQVSGGYGSPTGAASVLGTCPT